MPIYVLVESMQSPIHKRLVFVVCVAFRLFFAVFQNNARLQGLENADAMLGKVAAGKTGAVTTRSALSNIGNKVANTAVTRKKGLTDQTNKPVRVPTKAKAAALSKKSEKENTRQLLEKLEIKKDVEEKPASPAPMDISGNADTFPVANFAHVTDIDKDDTDNPQLVPEYVNEIYDYMRELECKFSISKR